MWIGGFERARLGQVAVAVAVEVEVEVEVEGGKTRNERGMWIITC